MQANPEEPRQLAIDDRHDRNPASNAVISDVILPETYEEVRRCNIVLNGNGEYFVHDRRLTDIRSKRGIGTMLETIEVTAEDGTTRRVLRLKENYRMIFFDRVDEFTMHRRDQLTPSIHRSSEEALLFLVQIIRHSVKNVQNRMLKQRETGGIVVFDIWWNYALCRIANLSKDESIPRENLGNYTAVMLFRELCNFIMVEMAEIVTTPAAVEKLRNTYGIDWVQGAWNARRIINKYGGESHPLNAIVTQLQRHLTRLTPGTSLPWGTRSPSKMCVICLSRPVETVLVPCG